MIIDLAVAVMAVTLAVVAAFMIPAFIEIRKTAAATRAFITYAESELKPALRELQETLTELNGISMAVASRTEDIKTFMEAMGDTGRNLRTINNVIGAVAGVVAGSSAWITGARVAGKLILERFSKKRRGE
jgi:uncharacterized protein YoxC